MKKPLLIVLLLIFSSSAFARIAWVDNKAICEKTQGSWRLFNNDCGASCENKFDLPICTAIPTYNCDCGKNRCWDYDKCVSNKVAKKYWDQIAEDNKADREDELATLKEQEDLFYKDVPLANNTKTPTSTTAAPTQGGGLAGDIPAVPVAVAANTPPAIVDPEAEKKKQLCEQKKGVWKEFKNGCVDSCSSKVSTMSMCTSALTFGCECGETKCWDVAQNSCVEIEDYKTMTAQPTTTTPVAASPITINPTTTLPNALPFTPLDINSGKKTNDPKSDNSFQPNSLGQPNSVKK